MKAVGGCRRIHAMVVSFLILGGATFLTSCHSTTTAYSLDTCTRRTLLHTTTSRTGAAIAAGLVSPVLLDSAGTATLPAHAAAAPSTDGLAARLAKKDPSVLRNRIFNAPPSAQVYPEWMRGEWRMKSSFAGYIFPSRKITRERLAKDFVVPGFQKCSIAQTADVGKENVQYEMRIDPVSGLEDRTYNLQQAINAYLGYRAVSDVIYNVKQNPNRLSIDFVDYKTINAERIELFCNARESEPYTIPNPDTNEEQDVFVASEYARQVTFGTGDTVGVPRQVVTNYGHFWTWKKVNNDNNQIKGNLLTAAYLDPQDSLYFEEPTLPVAIYSHIITGERITRTR